MGLRFESISAVFRADADDDSLGAELGLLSPKSGETLIEVSGSPPWPDCIGRRVIWAWRLTNQQGYNDGVRLELTDPGQDSKVVVELVVVASAVQVFVATRAAIA